MLTTPGRVLISFITIEPIDWDIVQKRIWSQIEESQLIERNLSQIPSLTLYRGIGEFVGDYEMRVKFNSGTYSPPFQGKRFVIASGARPFIPPIKGLGKTGYVTSESFFGDKFPTKPWKSLVIIGGGVIAVEFAHIFSAVGTANFIIHLLFFL